MEPLSNPVSYELEAMAAIGLVLGCLDDPAARQRVLRWAAERFAVDTVAQQTPASPVTADPGLAIDSLDDLFVAGSLDVVQDEPIKKLPIDAALRSFAADFQRFTEEWNAASV